MSELEKTERHATIEEALEEVPDYSDAIAVRAYCYDCDEGITVDVSGYPKNKIKDILFKTIIDSGGRVYDEESATITLCPRCAKFGRIQGHA